MDSRPKSPESMIQGIAKAADESLWSQLTEDEFNMRFMKKEVYGLGFWVTSRKSFQIFAHGSDENGPVQFWSGTLVELTRDGKTYDRMCGSSKRISTEDVTKQFMDSLSEVK